jgi:hypothetical protein
MDRRKEQRTGRRRREDNDKKYKNLTIYGPEPHDKKSIVKTNSDEMEIEIETKTNKNMDTKYGTHSGQYNLSPRKYLSYSHLHTLLLQ